MAMLDNTFGIFAPTELPSELARLRVVDERTAASFLGLSPQTLERMRKLGTAPKHIVLSPRRLGYRVADLLSWLDQRAATTNTAA